MHRSNTSTRRQEHNYMVETLVKCDFKPCSLKCLRKFRLESPKLTELYKIPKFTRNKLPRSGLARVCFMYWFYNDQWFFRFSILFCLNLKSIRCSNNLKTSKNNNWIGKEKYNISFVHRLFIIIEKCVHLSLVRFIG